MTSYKRTGNTITLTMEDYDYNELMLLFGFALAKTQEPEQRRWLIQCLNNLNTDNPEYVPYSLPGDPA
jgi:hypothetical protein